jgi:hypothetical protein
MEYWRKWSLVRKIQVGILLTGMLATVGIMVLCIIIPGNGQTMSPFTVLAAIVQTPTIILLQMTHSHFVEYIRNPPNNTKTVLWFCVVAGVNSIIALVAAILLALLARLATKSKG